MVFPFFSLGADIVDDPEVASEVFPAELPPPYQPPAELPPPYQPPAEEEQPSHQSQEHAAVNAYQAEESVPVKAYQQPALLYDFQQEELSERDYAPGSPEYLASRRGFEPPAAAAEPSFEQMQRSSFFSPIADGIHFFFGLE
jgi:hypothetical protein